MKEIPFAVGGSPQRAPSARAQSLAVPRAFALRRAVALALGSAFAVAVARAAALAFVLALAFGVLLPDGVLLPEVGATANGWGHGTGTAQSGSRESGTSESSPSEEPGPGEASASDEASPSESGPGESGPEEPGPGEVAEGGEAQPDRDEASGATGPGPAGEGTPALVVTVTGTKDGLGPVRCALFRGEKGFPSDPDQAFRKALARSKRGKARCVFDQVPPGRYAVAVHHDENGNETMDTNFFGIPKEGYGASNNAKGRMGPPSYDDARFQVDGPTRISLKIRY